MRGDEVVSSGNKGKKQIREISVAESKRFNEMCIQMSTLNPFKTTAWVQTVIENVNWLWINTPSSA